MIKFMSSELQNLYDEIYEKKISITTSLGKRENIITEENIQYNYIASIMRMINTVKAKFTNGKIRSIVERKNKDSTRSMLGATFHLREMVCGIQGFYEDEIVDLNPVFRKKASLVFKKVY